MHHHPHSSPHTPDLQPENGSCQPFVLLCRGLFAVKLLQSSHCLSELCVRAADLCGRNAVSALRAEMGCNGRRFGRGAEEDTRAWA